ncbi:hypothetical protein [Verrucosispora sp. WMMD573]|uniref:hypothetical protein n=1 Tax=Verrucosispora sp. WMMD573 TaxID=3015149 RepID=UPI00248AD1AB|nr:hypothetical protein [Verrucosispora sp. WMMD573]WBB56483.1 hypothetical protein O7601_10670 [Verrucosispora sp. WMMD573]
MREPGVGRSGGLTEWQLMNVADMWACLQDHHTDNHWRHVAGWRKIAELAGQHLARLRTYRERLAQAWPPETSAASHAYLAKLDELINQVQHTHDAATTNQTALSAATQALSSSRDEIGKIYQEYADKLQQKRSWEETAADPKAAAASRAIQPPVTDADLERLNIQARNVMYALSTELHQAQTQLRHPPPTKAIALDGAAPDTYGGDAAPIIPPIAPFSPPRRQTSLGEQSFPPEKLLPNSSTPAIGPVLGGVDSHLIPSPAPLSSPGTTPPSLNSPISIAGIPPTSGLVIRPSLGGPSQETKATGKVTSSSTSKSLSSSKTPQSGWIGGPTGRSAIHSGASNNQPRSLNPFGGLIGGGAAGTAPTGGAGSRPGGKSCFGIIQTPVGGSPRFAPASGTGPSRTCSPFSRQDPVDDNEARRWDPDDPWAVDTGISPIIRPPSEEGPIDPGPAIGLTQ